MRLRLCLCLMTTLAFPGLVAAGETELPLHIGGRAAPATAQSGALQQWPGTYYEARFKGPRLDIQFNDDLNHLLITIDGKTLGDIKKAARSKISLTTLSAGEHTVRIEKQSESQGGSAGIGRFSVAKAENALPAPTYARQIEFIGDSYTVGYGNTSPKRDCTTDEVWATTDTTQAFGPITAKAFGADYQINAYSGRGVVRNYNGFAGDTLPGLYPYALFDGKTAYDPANWQPQIIVIGLGTNDFSTPLKADEKWKTRDELHADYEATYVAFVKSLRAKNPDAWFILMAADNVAGETLAEVTKVEAALKGSGEARLSLVAMKGLNFGGCHSHPDVADDKAVSASLRDFINAHPDLWQGK
jgi:lysophospholipase L1-like esterase